MGLVQRPASQDDAPTQWRLEAASGEYCFLVNRWTGKRIRPNTHADGGPVVQRLHTWRGRWTQWLLVPTAPAQVFYHHNDHLGTLHKLTDQHGSIVWEAYYSPFGQATVNGVPPKLYTQKPEFWLFISRIKYNLQPLEIISSA